VDSAVAAALLKKQGHEVIGVFLNFFGGKTSQEGWVKAKNIAKKLNIPIKKIDARKEFRKKIIDCFIDFYKKGLTPNPCVVCNKEMKFGLLFDLMKKEKADFVATGHYARINRVTRNMEHVTKKGLRVTCLADGRASYELWEAKDKTKNQSYFLYRLTQKELSKIIFPLGDYKKTEVKKIAKKLKLPVAPNESQDICFVRDNDVNRFLRQCIKMKPGKIVDMGGNVLGKHRGLPLYTIGQRKGIEIGGTGPYFVIEKNIQKNELFVAKDPGKLLTKKFQVSQVNWIKRGIKFPLRAQLQIRYRAEKFSATIKRARSGKWEVRCEKFLRAVTAGQSAVFYKNKEVLGGGIII